MESESDPLTCRPVDLFEKEPLKGKWEVHLHTATMFGEDPSKDLGGDREHTNKQTLLDDYITVQLRFTPKYMDHFIHPFIQLCPDCLYANILKPRKETKKRGGELGVMGVCLYGIPNISPNQLLASKQLNRKLIKVTLGWLMVKYYYSNRVGVTEVLS